MVKLIKKKLSLVILIPFLSMVFFGCSKENYTSVNTPLIQDTTTHHNDTTHTSKTYTFLALGDSYTIGQSVQPSERFPAQTVRLIINDSIKITDPVYIATTGWTTINLINAITQQNPPNKFDIVTLLIGVNDQYQRMDTGGYRTRFTQLLNVAINLAAGKKTNVFVLSIPDYSATPFVSASEKARVSMEIDWYNAINKAVTIQNNIAYTNITPSTRQAATDPSLIAQDGLHPSGKEYTKWAQMLAPLIRNAIK